MSILGAFQGSAADKPRLGHDGQQREVQGQPHDRIPIGDGRSSGGSVRNNNGGDVDITIPQRMISASTGSLMTSLLVTPLDVVRVRLQSQASTKSTSTTAVSRSISNFRPSTTFANLPPNLGVTACCREVFWIGNGSLCIATPTISPSISAGNDAAICAAEETQRRTFNSTADGLRKIARNEGLAALWRGLSPTLAMAVPANVIYFTSYDWLRYNPASPFLRTDGQGLPHIAPTAVPLLAGSVARIVAATVISPIEMFRTRLQASSTASKGNTRELYTRTLVGLKNLVLQNGFKSLWRGWSLTVWRDVPFSGIYWWGYETIFQALQRRHDSPTHTSTFISSFTAGFTSGATASVLTMPFDVGKTRQQIYMLSPHASPSDMAGAKGSNANIAGTPAEWGMARFLRKIYREEGVSGLWKGWAARTLKVAPACAIMISSYELGKVFAKQSNDRKRGEA
ncbi:MAG: hypothetical protein M1814_005020 [Vezdaea aestivalis]|nr:MAG: hypothetical protein M1814_005020 [Vezdaea aestivalis]